MDVSQLGALVTGGASGLGLAVVERLAAAGAEVAILDIDQNAAQATADRIGGFAEACDVTDQAAAEAAIASAVATLGKPLRVAVNCAGIGHAKRIVGRDGPLPLAEFAKVVDVNLIGTFNIMRLAAAAIADTDPLDVDGERGVIISTASVAAFDGQIGQAAYAASKGGIVALTLPAARELGRFGIRVLAVAPGILDTPMATGLKPEVLEQLAALPPFPKRLGRPEEFAALVLHMIENPLLNGTVVRLDGAMRMP